VLVVAPHPDDEIACGGTLLLHARAGDEVHVVYVTDGRGSRAGGLGPDEMAAQRRDEVDQVAPALGLRGAHWLGLREWEWDEATLERALGGHLREREPDVVYVTSRLDFHPEHVRVAGCVARALLPAAPQGVKLRIYQIQVPLTPLLVNLVAPISTVADELLAAMRRYRSQVGSIERCHRMKRYAAACYGMAGHAEEFWEIDADAYRRVHAAPADPAGAFRGVRWWPFTDPLAYLRGLGARRRAAHAAQGAGAEA
jgi:LmbE family N-acetylglucosaminyl deacetylase